MMSGTALEVQNRKSTRARSARACAARGLVGNAPMDAHAAIQTVVQHTEGLNLPLRRECGIRADRSSP